MPVSYFAPGMYDLAGEESSGEDAAHPDDGDGCSGEKVVLNFGWIRPYKGLDLIRPCALAMPEAVFEVVGPSDDEHYLAWLRDEYVGYPNVRLRPGFVPERVIGEHFARPSVLLQPYVGGLNSGVGWLAATCRVRVVMSNGPALRELRRFLGKCGAYGFARRSAPADDAVRAVTVLRRALKERPA